MNPFIENKDKISEILGYVPSDIFLEIAWEQLIIYLGYNPLLSARIEKGTAGDSNTFYPLAKPLVSVEELKINSSVVIDYDIYKNSIIYNYPLNKSYMEFDYPVYELNKIDCKYTAGYEELPSSFYLIASLLVDIYNSEEELSSYSIDTISESYVTGSKQKRLINLLEGLK